MDKDKSKVVLVTGATGGIGKSIVTKFAERGMTLAIADKDEEQANKLAYERLRLNPGLVEASCIIGNACKANTAACLDNGRVNSFAFTFQIDSKA